MSGEPEQSGDGMTGNRVDFNSARGVLALWGGWVLAILAWLLHLRVSYGAVGWYCREQRELSPVLVSVGLNLWTLVCALLAVAGILLARRNLRSVGAADDAGRRSRFMGWSGYLMSLFFLAVILVQGLPNLVLGPCQ